MISRREFGAGVAGIGLLSPQKLISVESKDVTSAVKCANMVNPKAIQFVIKR